MKLIFGLGNPDKLYQNTRHNIGQIIISRLSKDFTLKSKLKSMVSHQSDCLYAYSTDYMNLSGYSVSLVANYYKISPQDIYIIHDDLDLPVGDYKLQFDRGPAGHNGVQSVIDQLSTQAFWRYRIGIGHPRLDEANGVGGLPNIPVEAYVLEPFPSSEKVIIDPVIDKIVKTLRT